MSYPDTDPVTGSSNISKASPEWAEVLAQAGQRYDPQTQYRVHVAYEIVNEQVTAGIAWSKCANCGSPFKGVSEICSEDCAGEYSAYLMEEL